VRQLLPVPAEVPAAALVATYDWPEPTWLRACMVMGLDGGIAGPDGVSRSISSPADRRVLAATRALADAYLVGAGTVRAEGYSPVQAKAEHAGLRRAAGQRPAAVLAVVSGSCRFEWSAARFQHGDEPPIVLTSERATQADRDAATAAGCEVVVAGAEQVEPRAALAALHGRGLTRITAEGGPSLLRQLLGAGLVDELDLTVAPVVGAAHLGLEAFPVPRRMMLVHVLEDEGFLFLRHRREVT
jgi:5-amino-6-(5-phosphoribosylamino)uracil reductase